MSNRLHSRSSASSNGRTARVFPHRSAESVERNYCERLDEARRLPPDTSAAEFLRCFADGGVVWRVFWLHIWSQGRQPIFDQHVYRAMCWLTERRIVEQLPTGDGERLRLYIDEYLPFWTGLGFAEPRRLDRALFGLGKVLRNSPHLFTGPTR